MDIISNLLVAVQNNDVDSAQKFLSLINIATLKRETSYTLLNRLLITARQYDSKDVVKAILDAWSEELDDLLSLSIYTSLFLEPLITVEALAFAAKALNNVSFMTVIDELTRFDSSPAVEQACYKASQVFGKQTRETLTALLDSMDVDNFVISQFLKDELAKQPIYADIPDWIINKDNPSSEEIIFELKEPEVTMPELTIDQQYILLTQGMEASGLTFDEQEQAETLLKSILRTASNEQRRQLLMPVLEKEALDKLQDDKYLFRLLGPANPLYDSSVEEMSFGGYRMFSCCVYDEDEFGEIHDWFTGICDVCNKGIKRRQYALRRPKSSGGWVGIYCSFDCVREGLNIEEENNKQPDLAARIMVDNIEKQIKEIGIYDLIPVDRYVDVRTRPGSGVKM